MKYESTILKRLIDTYGVVGNPRYISEIIKEFIVRGKERFPELFTYQADWLAHIDEFGLNPSYTVSYTGQSIYAPNTLEKPVKSAILKGSTKYRDIDTGEFLETFEEGRNLELVSVKMPVLTTTGKNLFDIDSAENKYFDGNLNLINVTDSSGIKTSGYIKVKPNTTYTFTHAGIDFSSVTENVWITYGFYQDDKGVLCNGYTKRQGGDSGVKRQVFSKITTPSDCHYIRIGARFLSYDGAWAMLVEGGYTSLNYEPFKTNILTVNEDVTLRSNGSVHDELDLLTGKLTQRIGEDGVVLSQEVVKTVDLTIQNQNGQNVKQLMSFNGGTHFNTGSLEGSPLPSVAVTVETDLEETLNLCSTDGNTL